jgi:hypothetical protein
MFWSTNRFTRMNTNEMHCTDMPCIGVIFDSIRVLIYEEDIHNLWDWCCHL